MANNHHSSEQPKGIWYTYFGGGGSAVVTFLWVITAIIWIFSVIKWG